MFTLEDHALKTVEADGWKIAFGTTPTGTLFSVEVYNVRNDSAGRYEEFEEEANARNAFHEAVSFFVP